MWLCSHFYISLPLCLKSESRRLVDHVVSGNGSGTFLFSFRISKMFIWDLWGNQNIRRVQVAFSWRSGVCCFDVSWMCCCSSCSWRVGMGQCSDCMTCSSCSNPCRSCRIPECQCCFPCCWSSQCFKKWKCSCVNNCCCCCSMPKCSCPSCPTCSCPRCTCNPKCPNLNICSCCHKSCCFPCYYCM